MGDTHNTQKKTYIMALDQGTTSSRCILFDKQGNICSMAQKEFTQIYPQPGWVEHNPMEIWSSQLGVAIESMAVLGITDDQIEAIGITTSGKPRLSGIKIPANLYTMLLYGSAEGLQNTQILLKRMGLQKQSVTKPVLLLMRIFLEPS